MVSFGSFEQGNIMVSEWTWRVHGVLEFILARNYRRLGVEMERSGIPNWEYKHSAHRPRHARHDTSRHARTTDRPTDQWRPREPIESEARENLGGFSFSALGRALASRKRVPWA